LKHYYPSDSTGLFASLLQDKRVQTAIPSDTKLSQIVANLKTAIDSATDPSVRRAYLSVVADVTGTTIQQVMRDYNCTEHEAKDARIHARLRDPDAYA
jgi:phage tail sheath gpL-like